MRRPILYIVIVVFMLILIIAGFFYIKNQKSFDSSALKAVPLNSECIFRIRSVKDIHQALLGKEGMYKELKESKIFEDFERAYSLVDSLVIAKNLDLNIDKSVTCATKFVGKDKIDVLYIIELGNNKELKALMNIVDDFLPRYTNTKKSYSGEEIYMYTKNTERYNIAYVDGLFLMSSSVIFLEESIRQIKSKYNLLSLSSFVSVSKTVDSSADFNLFINNSNIASISKQWAGSEYFSFLNNINYWGKWTALDIELNKDNLSLNGFSCSSHNDFELFNVIANQQSVESTLMESIPANTSTFSLLTLSNVTKYREDIIKYRGRISTLSKYRRSILELDKAFSSKLEDKFFSFFAGEAACLSMSINSLDVNANKISVFKSIGEEKLRTEMMEMLSSFAKKEKASISSFETILKIDKELTYKIYNLAFSDIAYRLMGDIFYKAPTDYFTIIGNNLVFAGSVKILTEYIQALSLNKAITDDTAFKRCSKHFSDKANFLFYANTNSSLSLVKSYFNKEKQGLIDKYKDDFSKFHSIGYQLSSADSMVFNNLFVLYSDELVQKPQIDWESSLDANILIKPSIVKNYTSGDTEILVQDDKYNLYLINSQGSILWKLPIEDKINSEIYQVDALRNNKLQYLFSTAKNIYLLDRNGNNVNDFPVKLKSKTSMGITLLDYENNRNYRIVVPCEDRKIYLYDIKGNIMKGWEFKQAENAINSKLWYKKIAGKDYILFKDKFKLYILDRKGKTIAKSKNIELSNNEIVIVEGRNAHMLVTDMDASVYKIDFTGMTEKIKAVSGMSKNHFFTATDLDNDGNQDLIFVDKKSLSAYSREEKIIDLEFDAEIKNIPIIYTLNNSQKMIGIVDTKSSKAYLIDKNGNNYSGFPVSGNTFFSIAFLDNKISNFNLFIGSGDLSLYKYKVQK